MIPLLIAACVLAQDTARFDDLIRKTNEIEAFVAVYRIRPAGSEETRTLRITFRAPDEFKLEFQPFTVCSLRQGVMDARISPPTGKTQFAHVPWVDMMTDRPRRLADVVRAEFPGAASDWSTETSCGGQLEMRIVPAAEADMEEVELKAEYVCPRKALFGWLDTFEHWSGSKSEDDEHFVFRSARGTELLLSKRTGFIDSIVKQKKEGVSSFKLETLDLHPTLPKDSFDLADPAPDAADVSAGVSAPLQHAITRTGRRRFLGWISTHVADRKIEWNADARSHARKVLEFVHSDGLPLENAAWIEHTQAWMDGLGGWLRDGFKLPEADDFAGKVHDARQKLFENLQGLLRASAAGFSVDEADVPDASLRTSLGELETAAMQTAFEHAVQNPLLEKFDDAVERAKRGG